MNWRISVLRYWLAMNATAFDSAVHSLVAFGGAASAHQAAAEFNVNVPAISLMQLGIVFLSSFGWAVLRYLDAHPLEDIPMAVVTTGVTAGATPAGARETRLTP